MSPSHVSGSVTFNMVGRGGGEEGGGHICELLFQLTSLCLLGFYEVGRVFVKLEKGDGTNAGIYQSHSLKVFTFPLKDIITIYEASLDHRTSM